MRRNHLLLSTEISGGRGWACVAAPACWEMKPRFSLANHKPTKGKQKHSFLEDIPACNHTPMKPAPGPGRAYADTSPCLHQTCPQGSTADLPRFQPLKGGQTADQQLDDYGEVYHAMREQERAGVCKHFIRLDPDYLGQRRVLVEWMAATCEAVLTSTPTTVHLAVAYLDAGHGSTRRRFLDLFLSHTATFLHPEDLFVVDGRSSSKEEEDQRAVVPLTMTVEVWTCQQRNAAFFTDLCLQGTETTRLAAGFGRPVLHSLSPGKSTVSWGSFQPSVVAASIAMARRQMKLQPLWPNHLQSQVTEYAFGEIVGFGERIWRSLSAHTTAVLGALQDPPPPDKLWSYRIYRFRRFSHPRPSPSEQAVCWAG